MPITINGTGTITGIGVGGLENGIITPAELSTGAPSWDSQYNLTNIASINSGPLAGFRNLLINGGFEIGQRATSGTANNNYILDRWIIFYSGTAPTWFRGAGGPLLDTYFNYLLGVTGAAGNTASNVGQRIESLNIAPFAGKTVTISAYVLQQTGVSRNVTLAATYPPSPDTWTSDTSIGSSTTSVANNTWTRVSWTVTLPSAGTPNGLQVQLYLGAIPAGQTIYVTGFQVEPGSVATPFERRPIGAEFDLCRRYFSGVNMFLAGYASTGVANSYTLQLGTTMRINPTITVTASANTNTTGSTIIQVDSAHVRHTSLSSAVGGFVSSASATLSAEI